MAQAAVVLRREREKERLRRERDQLVDINSDISISGVGRRGSTPDILHNHSHVTFQNNKQKDDATNLHHLHHKSDKDIWVGLLFSLMFIAHIFLRYQCKFFATSLMHLDCVPNQFFSHHNVSESNGLIIFIHNPQHAREIIAPFEHFDRITIQHMKSEYLKIDLQFSCWP